jgi:hypothetical protein
MVKRPGSDKVKHIDGRNVFGQNQWIISSPTSTVVFEDAGLRTVRRADPGPETPFLHTQQSDGKTEASVQFWESSLPKKGWQRVWAFLTLPRHFYEKH